MRIPTYWKLPKNIHMTLEYRKELKKAWGEYTPMRLRGDEATISFSKRMNVPQRVDTFFHEVFHYLWDTEQMNRKLHGLPKVPMSDHDEEELAARVACVATALFMEEWRKREARVKWRIKKSLKSKRKSSKKRRKKSPKSRSR